MATSFQRESATIYEFPLRGRFAAKREEAERAAAAPRVVFGSGWYHDEAIQDAERARKN
jgi:hypothetical protein